VFTLRLIWCGANGEERINNAGGLGAVLEK
jgi:hypothetical protein